MLLFEALSSATSIDAERQSKVDAMLLPEISDTGSAQAIIETSGSPVEGGKFGLGNFYAVNITTDQLSALEENNDVKKIWAEKEYHALLDVSVPLIKVGSFWNNSYNGSGIKVCVLDTGINKNHPALAGRVIAEKDFSGSGNTNDNYGHGTHVAGIIASNDPVYRGVAPGALLLNAKVLNDAGSGSDQDIMNGIDWCIAQDADILTLSLGGPSSEGDGSDPLSQYVDLAVEAGKIVTIAAGNSGPYSTNSECRNRDATGASYSICEPGLSKEAITVGSTQSGKASIQDVISGFSSRGPTFDGRIKPDVTAPGEVIVSSVGSSSFSGKSGTSMATPHVAGLAALIKQARPDITPAETKTLLMNSAIDLGQAGKDNVYGAGRVNASELFSQLNNTALGSSSQKVYSVFPSGNAIKATVVGNNLSISLLDPSGAVRALSASPFVSEQILSFQNTTGGSWKILVSGNDYALASNLQLSRQYFFASGNVSFASYHKINVTENSTLFIGVDQLSNVLFNLSIYSPNASLVLSSASNASHQEIILPSQKGTWTLKIISNSSEVIPYSITSSHQLSYSFSDITPPFVSLLQPENNTIYNASNVSISFLVSDDSSMVCSAVIDSASSYLGTIPVNTTVNLSVFLSYGSHSFFVTCIDQYGNSGASSPVQFFVDTRILEINFVDPTPSNQAIIANNSIYINLTATRPVSNAFLEWNGTNESLNELSPLVWFAFKENLSDGLYSFRVYANSSHAANVSEVRTVMINSTKIPASFNDSSAPEIQIISPETRTYSSPSINLLYIVKDNSTDKCWFIINGNYFDLPNCTNTTITAAPGGNTLVLHANDTSGNVNSSSVQFTYEIPAPPQPSPPPSNGGGIYRPPLPKANITKTNSTINKTQVQTVNKTEIETLNKTAENTNIEITRNNTVVESYTSPATGFATFSPVNLIEAGIMLIAGLIFAFWFIEKRNVEERPTRRKRRKHYTKRRKS